MTRGERSVAGSGNGARTGGARPWLVSLSSAAGASQVAATLRRQGFGDPSGPGGGPGLILAGGPSRELLDLVGTCASSGDRVLVALTADAAAVDPWTLLGAGAGDVLRLGGDRVLDGIRARLDRWAEVDLLVDSPEVRQVAGGTAPSWRTALRDAVEIARFTSSPMLITGETGTGKEVVARLVHALDPRPDRGELVLVDCTTVVASLSGSEFFGHAKGAFTGATSSRAGAFALADGGTLFLDEVGELPLALQAELLRVVQEGVYKPVGGDNWRSTAFRLLAATNRDLVAEAADGRFRTDFYFRLAGAMVHLPPLRERRADIVPLFLRFFADASGRDVEPALDPAVVRLLHERCYPGNVRDLRQLAIRTATRHVGAGPVTPGDIPPEDRWRPPLQAETPLSFEPDTPSLAESVARPAPDAAGTRLDDAIRELLGRGLGLKELKAAVADAATRIALAETGGPTAAAKLLGVSRRAVDYRKATSRESAHEGDGAASSDASS